MTDRKSKKRAGLDNALAGQVGGYAGTGLPAPAEPDTAEVMGAFEEYALGFEEAFESRFDEASSAKGGNDE